MNLNQWLDLFSEQARKTDVWQWISVGCGAAEVLLARANSVWLYPAGIVSSAIGIVLLYEAKLFAESGLSLYYVVVSIYGWLHWLHKRDQPALPITPANAQEWKISGLIIVAGGALTYYLLKSFTTSDVPFLDAFVSATAWAGTWLLARRKIENWLLLNLSNIVAIPLLLYKGLPLFAALTLFLFIVACFGYRDWKAIYRNSQTPQQRNEEEAILIS